MTNEEKIRLVLETLGVDNVRQATKAMRDLDNAIDNAASTMEGSKRKFNPHSLLILGQAIDDIQYGLRGILNNIPQLVQAFGGGAAAAGGFQIAMIAINFALTKLGSLIEDTTPKVKPFAEQLDDLADAGKQSSAQVDALAGSAKRLAASFGPSLIESFDTTIKRMDEIVATMREAQALQKEIAEENAAREKGQAKIDEKGKSKDTAALFGEFFGGMSEDEALALRDRVARDSRQRAESELIDSEMSALEGAGTWSGLKYRTLTGAQSPAQKRSEAQSKAAAREAIRKRINQDGSIDEQSQKIASGLIEEALGGDPRAIQRMRDAGGFGEFETANLEDIAFQESLSERSRAVERRNARNIQADRRSGRIMREFNAAALKPDEAVKRGLAAQGPAGGVPVLMGDGGNLAGMIMTPEQQAESARQAEIRNAVLNQINPTQMAALRNAQSVMGPNRGRKMRDRKLRQLEERDLALFSNALMERGMGRGEAQQVATESLIGGQAAFQLFASSIGKNLDNSLRAQEASVEYFRRMQARMDEFAMRQQMLMQQMNVLGGTNQQQARPPARVRN